MNMQSRIVVGTDGSPSSAAAVQWAVGEAERRNCVLEIVCAWQSDPQSVGSAPQFGLAYQSPEAIRAEHEKLLNKSVLTATEGGTRVTVRGVLIAGWPPKALTDRSEGAELLVVGRHQHSWVSEKLLGSVSSYCIRHAHCPVVIVQPPKPVEQHTAERPAKAAAEPFTPGPLL